MRLTYMRYARLPMGQRDSTEDEVEAVVRTRQTPGCDADGNPMYGALVDGRLIEVVIAARSYPPRMITVWDEG